MKKEDFDNLPFISREELVRLRKYCLDILQENKDSIYKDDVPDVLHQFRDITGKFAFNIREAKFDGNKSSNTYKVYFKPENKRNINGVTLNSSFEEIKMSLPRWIQNVKDLHSITEEYFNPDKKFYDAEFSDFFVNSDDDSEIAPFDIDRQEMLFYFLSYAETKFLQSDLTEEQKIELVAEISELKEDIPHLTKRKVVTALSKIAQKTKSFSNKLFHEVFDVLKKEAIKQALYEGIKHLPNAMKQIEHWLSIFN